MIYELNLVNNIFLEILILDVNSSIFDHNPTMHLDKSNLQ